MTFHMDSSPKLLQFTTLFFLVSLFDLTCSFSSMHQLCHYDECSVLLQFRESFIINRSASSDPSAYPKSDRWKRRGKACECCSWDGVECEEDTGYVITLDLTSSCLSGSLYSNSTLFRLLHLQWLSLADNDFKHSKIPSEFGNLSRLSHLNVSFSSFYGQIPQEILQLSKLVSLDLSSNFLQLKNPGFTSLVEKLRHLKVFHLNKVNISSTVPQVLANLSSLTSLFLEDCGLRGEFPKTNFQLVNLQSLSLRFNPNLTGYMPVFLSTSPLEVLKLSGTSFSGMLPYSIGYLKSLNVLEIYDCKFSGPIPSSLGNLTNLRSLEISGNNFSGPIPSSLGNLTNLRFLGIGSNNLSGPIPSSLDNLTNLRYLDISRNNFSGPIPSSLGNLTNLRSIDISLNNFSGLIPSSLGNLTNLRSLDISSNHFSGPIPSSLDNLTNLRYLDIARNNFSGPISSSLGNLTNLRSIDISLNNFSGLIPSSLGNLTNLRSLDIWSNHFSGPIPSSLGNLTQLTHLYLNNNHLSGQVNFDLFLNLKNLAHLRLAYNDLSLITKDNYNFDATLPEFELLGLASCNLRKIPNFLQNQNKLQLLVLSNNNIHGQLPKWLLNTSKESLTLLDLSFNSLTGFESNQSPIVLPWTNLLVLDLSNNILEGFPPVPPPSILVYHVHNNKLVGEISSFICNLNSVQFISLSNNSLGGMLPECLGDLNNSPLMLDLRDNKFICKIPQTFKEGCRLRMIDFSQNQLLGKVPRSLTNCTLLEYLNLGSNSINDTFPYWLGSLAVLKVLILRSNEFHGAIQEPRTKCGFPMLHIFDLSNNSFNGKMPSQYFQMWYAMKFFDVDALRYLGVETSFVTNAYWLIDPFNFSMVINNKGTETYYEKIHDRLVAIDLSGNRFEGVIPEVISSLKALRVLNLSNNILSGHIPSSLGNLSELESLDLSHNKLSGEIPPQLVQATSLEKLDVSYNDLVGGIPHGNQFDTFENSSYKRNSGLCGKPLSRECGNPENLHLKQDEGSYSVFDFGWEVVLIGYASGLAVGIAIGCFFNERKHIGWFTHTFGIKRRHRRM